ncbi:acyl transferase/acyl hydrolase/lysophospholipase [Geopyxis carbonaria]|nr:acyl transferase/acyl hydrolase/lysophospholipase [Geopyxis carbonaria]
MQTSTKITLGTLVTVGAIFAYYHTSSRRRTLPPPPGGQRLSVHSSSGSPPGDDRKDAQRASRILLETGPDSQWQRFSEKLAATKASVVNSVASVSVTSVLPDWSLGLPDWITRLQRELNMEQGSLAETIWKEARDPQVNPEVAWDATVRLSPNLCDEEREFLRTRRHFTRRALADYLGIPVGEIHEDDIPIIAATGSGGGLRAMVASAGYYKALKDAGLYDCTTYTAGVSGSCWLQSVYLSSIGQQSFDRVVQHLKNRICVHIAYPPKALELLDNAPTNKYLLRGVVEKLKIGQSTFGLVDLYGLLLGARLMVPSNEMIVRDEDLKLSQQRRFVDKGYEPMPIYTAVRHEIPGIGAENETNKTIDPDEKKAALKKSDSENNAWFQWFEISPYEVYSEDLEAGIPTWGLGRKYENGKNVDKEVPELKLPLLFGIFGSAFCATLSHYYHEVRPFITSLSMLGKLDAMVLQRNDSLIKVHPIDPATVPNYVKGLKDSLPASCPESLYESETIQLMDAGMSNNLACYPLMRKGRNVDILIAFDSSADIQTANWIGYTEGYAKQRKIQGWPVGAGWPQPGNRHASEELDEAQARSTEEAQRKLDEAREMDNSSLEATAREVELGRDKNTLGPCTIWVGRKETRESNEEPPPGNNVEKEWQPSESDAGIVVAYFPLIKNENVPDVDPEVSPYLSTWNFEWTPDQVDNTIALAKANFAEGAERLKRTVRAVYERKKRLRLERERQDSESKDAKEDVWHEVTRRRHGSHTDHFS